MIWPRALRAPSFAGIDPQLVVTRVKPGLIARLFGSICSGPVLTSVHLCALRSGPNFPKASLGSSAQGPEILLGKTQHGKDSHTTIVVDELRAIAWSWGALSPSSTMLVETIPPFRRSLAIAWVGCGYPTIAVCPHVGGFVFLSFEGMFGPKGLASALLSAWRGVAESG